MKIDFITPLKEAFLIGIVAAIIFIPIVGLPLKGYEIKNNLPVALWIVFAIVAGRFTLSILYQLKYVGPFLKRFFSQKNLSVQVAKKTSVNKEIYLLWGILFAIICIFPFFLNKYYTVILIQCLIYIILGLGLNIVIGWAGMLDLGFVAFYAVGAYSLGLLYQYAGLGFWEVLPIAAVIAGMTGALLGFPVLRMHGDYLAIVTLGFGEIIRLVLNNWTSFTGGPNGMRVPKITFFGIPFKKRSPEITFHKLFGIDYSPEHMATFIFFVLLFFVVLAIFFNLRLKKIPLGRAWEALREDEIACRSMGINHVNVKLAAFVLGASFGGIGGVFFGTYQGFINPTSFTFIESALIVAIVVLGGLGSIPGVVISAVVLTLLPEVFREFESFRILIFGIVMVVMMIWRPRGLFRIIRPKFEVSGVKE